MVIYFPDLIAYQEIVNRALHIGLMINRFIDYIPINLRLSHSAIATGIIERKKPSSRSLAYSHIRSSRNSPQIRKVAIVISPAIKLAIFFFLICFVHLVANFVRP